MILRSFNCFNGLKIKTLTNLIYFTETVVQNVFCENTFKIIFFIIITHLHHYNCWFKMMLYTYLIIGNLCIGVLVYYIYTLYQVKLKLKQLFINNYT